MFWIFPFNGSNSSDGFIDSSAITSIVTIKSGAVCLIRFIDGEVVESENHRDCFWNQTPSMIPSGIFVILEPHLLILLFGYIMPMWTSFRCFLLNGPFCSSIGNRSVMNQGLLIIDDKTHRYDVTHCLRLITLPFICYHAYRLDDWMFEDNKLLWCSTGFINRFLM